MTPSKVSIGGGNFPASHGDSRDDLGYGRLNPKYHIHKQLGNHSYPYRDEDEDLDDVETGVDEEEVWDRMEAPSGYDPGGGHYDPFSFAGSNTSLHGPAHIGENFAKNSMVPFPKMHNRRGNQTVGGTKSGTARGEGSTMAPTIDSGDRWGWSNPVYKEIDEDFENKDNYTLEDIIQDKPEYNLRECIRLILLEMI